MTIRYEDILSQAKPTVRKLIEFIGPEFVDEAWIAASVAMVRSPRSAWQSLPLREQQQLRRACQPGFEALCAAGIGY